MSIHDVSNASFRNIEIDALHHYALGAGMSDVLRHLDLWSRWFPIFNRARVQFSLLAGIMMPYNTDASTITTLANRKR